MKLRQVVMAVVMAGMVTGVQAATAPAIKAGLWEMKMDSGNLGGAKSADMAKMQAAMKQMQAQLASMPPEQRKMIEAQMGGMGMSMSESGGVRVCLTDEDIKRDAIPVGDGKCTTTVKSRTAQRWVVAHVCKEPATTGEAEVVFEGDRAYRVHATGVMTSNGKQQPYDMRMSMRHVSKDCGSVKPASALRQQHQDHMQHMQHMRQMQENMQRPPVN